MFSGNFGWNRPPDGTAHRKCGAPVGVVPLKWLEIIGNLSRKGIELGTIWLNMNYEFVESHVLWLPFDFCWFIAYNCNISKTFDSNFTQRPLTGRSVVLVFFFKEPCLRNQRGLLTNSQKKTDMKKEAKAYNMFFFGGVGGGSKKLIQIFQAPMMSEFFMS